MTPIVCSPARHGISLSSRGYHTTALPVTRHISNTQIRQLSGSGRVITAGYPDPVPGEIPYPSHLYSSYIHKLLASSHTAYLSSCFDNCYTVCLHGWLAVCEDHGYGWASGSIDTTLTHSTTKLLYIRPSSIISEFYTAQHTYTSSQTHRARQTERERERERERGDLSFRRSVSVVAAAEAQRAWLALCSLTYVTTAQLLDITLYYHIFHVH